MQHQTETRPEHRTTHKQRREKRRISPAEIEHVRACAGRGYSFSATARTLGLYPQQLSGLLKDASIDDIQFANGHRAAALSSWGEGGGLRKKYSRSAFGVTGTLSELKDHFGCKVSLVNLQRRVRKGMTVEEALTKEPKPKTTLIKTTDRRRGFQLPPSVNKKEAIERLKNCAERGHSINFAAQLLGIGRKGVRRLLDEEGIDIQFAVGCKSTAFRNHVKNLHESNRGRPASPGTLAALALGRKPKEAQCYTAFGVQGSLKELKSHFDCELSVKSLRERIKKGMAVEEALTTPPYRSPRGIYPPQFYEWLIKRRTTASAEIMAIVRSRLSPTMLQFQEPDHDIVITSRSAAHITADVRNHSSGEVLHRLGFLKSFSSGVLFVFNPIKQNHIRFIAFEPDCSALIQKLERGSHQEAVC